MYKNVFLCIYHNPQPAYCQSLAIQAQEKSSQAENSNRNLQNHLSTQTKHQQEIRKMLSRLLQSLLQSCVCVHQTISFLPQSVTQIVLKSSPRKSLNSITSRVLEIFQCTGFSLMELEGISQHSNERRQFKDKLINNH